MAKKPNKAGGGPSRRGLIGSAIGLAVSLTAGGFGLAYFRQSDDVNDKLQRAFELGDVPNRPTKKVSSALDVLILGNDARSDDQEGRSDTAILMHVDSDKQEAYGISIPRDLWVYVPEDPNASTSGTEAKFNAAYSWGGAHLTLQTLEAYSNVRIDHIVEINFDGLIKVVDAVGGVEMDVPKTFTSIHKPYRTFEAGTQMMNGEEALDFVRQRKQFADGDFQRMRNQQQLITGIMESAVSADILLSQKKLTDFINSMSDAIKVDTEFDVISTGIKLMDLRPSDIQFVTSPNLGTGWRGNSSVVVSDDETATELYEAVAEDTVGQWLDENPEYAK
ncbi:LCP family protein [Haloglycomyces albus]|uniref:LCP family protein n=1 Tax=Haloglycomyces albus TaxID=526067 RepID=UPI0004AF8701|nr:LCP family protein [Haloglycomyces albus]